MKKFCSSFIFVISVGILQAQDTIRTKTQTDTSGLVSVLKRTHLDLLARAVFMSTTNEGNLKDDQALGLGVGLGFHTAAFHGFDFSVSAFGIQHIWSTDIAAPDPQTQANNRYEVGLFDIQHPGVYSNLIRLEKFQLRYRFKKSLAQVGRMRLNTPFLNPQDGRLNVTLVEGAWLQFSEIKKLQISLAWIWKISPRSTMHWYDVGSSFGIYSSGVNVAGQKSSYANNIQNCAGIALANVSYSFSPKLRVQVWDMMVDNVINTSLVELNHEQGNEFKCFQGFMFIHQDALHNGGNADQSKTYIQKGSAANALSAQFGIKGKGVNLSLNYSFITNQGRFLSPREWGREPFYTFMYRERTDGAGDVNAIVIKANKLFVKSGVKAGLAFGNFSMPDVRNVKLNKYGMPSYQQINLDFNYRFKKYLKGLELSTVLAYKIGTGNTYGNLVYVMNKVNMLNAAITLEYKL